ncbi:hypothetical protein HFD88_005776 [Aspergillus terreus]|nr:hypothetical protein HFD88_005776 [Aspergillus terreus]
MSSSPSLAVSPEKYDLQPMAHVQTMEKQPAAFGGQFQPVFYPPVQQRTLGNPLPLGLCAFALGCFVLGLIEMQVRDITTPNILVGLAFGYGGLVQVCSGMWAIACGNTFGATVMASYGGFWLSTGIIFTLGGFNIMSTLIEADSGRQGMFYDSFGIFLMGWFIFTTLMMMCTLKSNFAFFILFFIVDLGVLLLAIGYLIRDSNDIPNAQIIMAGGFFILLSSFLAWYNAIAMLLDPTNSFFTLPVMPFPWSEESKQARRERKEAMGLQA